jgi:hypothetical protein
MKLFLSALALMFVLEGLPYAAAPSKTREALVWLAARSPEALRLVGVLMVVGGVVVLWLIQSLGL